MASIIPERMTVELEGDFVVFLIGMRINKPWKIHKWLPVALAMPRMLRELHQHPEIGCLGTINSLGLIIQYWRSFEHLEAYARGTDRGHWPEWLKFNQRLAGSRGDVGIWHETYLVREGEFECVYSGMPPYGLGKIGTLVAAAGNKASARERIRSAVASR